MVGWSMNICLYMSACMHVGVCVCIYSFIYVYAYIKWGWSSNVYLPILTLKKGNSKRDHF